MRTTFWTGCALSCAAIVTGCATSPGASTATPDVRQFSIEDFLDTTTMFGASFSPDERKILVSSDETGVLNAYAVAVDGGGQQRLTESTGDSILASSYFPHDERFIYQWDAWNRLARVTLREQSLAYLNVDFSTGGVITINDAGVDLLNDPRFYAGMRIKIEGTFSNNGVWRVTPTTSSTLTISGGTMVAETGTPVTMRLDNNLGVPYAVHYTYDAAGRRILRQYLDFADRHLDRR